MLEYNLKHNLLFFRLSSQIVPFASHPVCRFNWQSYFKSEFQDIGRFIKANKMRISMHPDQFTLINSLDKGIFKRSRKELLYHTQVLDLMGLDTTAKIQIHVGGVYGDKTESIRRFIARFKELDRSIKKRLVVENDDKSYTLTECLLISKKTSIPVLFDAFHHKVNSSGQKIKEAVMLAKKTWSKKDGILMVDYSQQRPNAPKGSHIESIKMKSFKSFLEETSPYDFDIMLEIKDKENSALKVAKEARRYKNFIRL